MNSWNGYRYGMTVVCVPAWDFLISIQHINRIWSLSGGHIVHAVCLISVIHQFNRLHNSCTTGEREGGQSTTTSNQLHKIKKKVVLGSHIHNCINASGNQALLPLGPCTRTCRGATPALLASTVNTCGILARTLVPIP